MSTGGCYREKGQGNGPKTNVEMLNGTGKTELIDVSNIGMQEQGGHENRYLTIEVNIRISNEEV